MHTVSVKHLGFCIIITVIKWLCAHGIGQYLKVTNVEYCNEPAGYVKLCVDCCNSQHTTCCDCEFIPTVNRWSGVLYRLYLLARSDVILSWLWGGNPRILVHFNLQGFIVFSCSFCPNGMHKERVVWRVLNNRFWATRPRHVSRTLLPGSNGERCSQCWAVRSRGKLGFGLPRSQPPPISKSYKGGHFSV